jgi:hypothetical protein
MWHPYWTTVDKYEPRNPNVEPARPSPAPATSRSPSSAEGEGEDAPVRITRRWKRLEDAIFRALLPFTEAADAVVRALAEVEPLSEPSS